MDDLTLLRQYVEARSEAAFAQIVERHVDLVYSTCLRLLRDRHAAEDASQAVFIGLARKAAGLRKGTVLAGWLYQAACFEASTAARKSRTRRKHEMAAAVQKPGVKDAAPATDARELDRALNRLGSTERHAIILRYFQGRSFGEVAAETGTSEEAARKRVTRGLERLRGLLRPTAGGAAMPVVAVELVLKAAVHPAPPALVAATFKAVAALPVTAAATAAGGSVTKGAILAMAISKAKAAAVAAVVLVVAGGAVVTYEVNRPPREQTVAIAGPSAANPSAPLPAVRAADGSLPTWRARFDEAYGLADGQNAKLITEPVPERQLFWHAEQKNMNYSLRPGEDFLTVEWDHGVPHWSAMRSFRPNLSSAFQSGAHLQGWEMMDPSLPLGMPFKGDWSFRKEATTQQVMDDLAGMVSERLGRRVRFASRPATVDVFVVRGSYRFTPLKGKPDNGRVELVGDRVTDDPSVPPRIEKTTVAGLCRTIEQLSNKKVFDETGSGATPLTLVDHADFSNADAVLKNVEAQTGLTIAREKRPVDSWCMVDPQGNVTTPNLLDFDQKYGLAAGEDVKHVAPPFGPERARFLELSNTNNNPAKPPASIFVEWDDTAHFNYPFDHLTLGQLLEHPLGIDGLTLDPSSIPLDTPMDGDWVVRRNVSADQRLAALAPILSRQLGRAVHFERRKAPVDVLVVSGTASPQQGVLLLTNLGPNGPKSPVFHVSVKDFLKSTLPSVVQRRVIDETSNPDAPLAWQASIRENKLAPDVAAKAVEEATGLHVTQEKRDAEMVMLVDGPTSTAAAAGH